MPKEEKDQLKRELLEDQKGKENKRMVSLKGTLVHYEVGMRNIEHEVG